MRDGLFEDTLGWDESAYYWYEDISQGIAIAGSITLGVYQTTAQFKAAKQGQQFLGKGYHKAGSRRWVSKDGMKQLRWDKFGHGKYGPHFNLEKWAFQIGTKGNYVLRGGNNHLFYLWWKLWSVVV